MKNNKYIIDKMIRAINNEMKKENLENVFKISYILTNLLYETNIMLKNDDIEKAILQISKKIPIKAYNSNEEIIFFYDGFGLFDRGLMKIYLGALCKFKRVIYITYRLENQDLSNIEKFVSSIGGKTIFIKQTKYLDQYNTIIDLLTAYKPAMFFFYSKPYDVVGATVLCSLEGLSERYVINLTDHAYWVGYSFLDRCIEYRDYGASISVTRRRIPVEKIVVLPYYPEVNFKNHFLGFPFIVKDNTKIVFSGGSLYKTYSKNNYYYRAIEYMLNNHTDVIFWYAGSGETRNLNKLKKAFPNRVFYTKERNDLIQIMEKIYLYISTYPVSGGLMFQYAAIAGKIPLTLSKGPSSVGVLKNEKELGIIFEDYNSFLEAIDYYLNNFKVVMDKTELLKKSVISKEEFEKKIELLLFKQSNNINKKLNIDDSIDIDVSIQKFNSINCYSLLAKKNSGILVRYLPFEYISGLIIKSFYHIVCSKIC